MSNSRSQQYSEILKSFLISHNVPHRFIEFDEPVKTVEQAARKVPPDDIAKSIVLVDSNQQPFMIILPAKNRISYRKVKQLLGVRDVRLGTETEVLEYSGYPVGGVPPFNNVGRAYLDSSLLQKTKIIAGGGDVNKLVELETRHIVDIIKPIVADLSRDKD